MKLIHIFSFFVYAHFCASQDFSYQELILEMRELRRTVKTLENKLEQQETITITHEKRIEALQDSLDSQSIELNTVKRELGALKQIRKEEVEKNHLAVATNSELSYVTTTVKKDSGNDNKRQGRLIPDPQNGNVSVAFYAFMSAKVTTIGDHNTLIFDHVVTNNGNAYHPDFGVFIAPSTGLYVFSWSIRTRAGEVHAIELAVDGKAFGETYSRSNGDDDLHSSATVVVQVTQGDNVFLRTSTRDNVAGIWSDTFGRSSFAGWKL